MQLVPCVTKLFHRLVVVEGSEVLLGGSQHQQKTRMFWMTIYKDPIVFIENYRKFMKILLPFRMIQIDSDLSEYHFFARCSGGVFDFIVGNSPLDDRYRVGSYPKIWKHWQRSNVAKSKSPNHMGFTRYQALCCSALTSARCCSSKLACWYQAIPLRYRWRPRPVDYARPWSGHANPCCNPCRRWCAWRSLGRSGREW